VKVSVSADAEQELTQAALFYARQANVELGRALIAEFERSVELLSAHPMLGAAWRGATRRLPLRRFPYSIVYLLHDAELRIVALTHQRRKPGYWRGRS
jgi:plasmid stabilization system protein ParE